jgi:DNA-binding transcriptional ArsR family regulator
MPRSQPTRTRAPAGPPQSIHRVKAEFFRLLGHPVRVRVLELLRQGERSVGELQVALDMESSGTSQHLSAMRRAGLLVARRQGTSVYYRVRDPRIFQMLEIARQILTSQLEETRALLDDLNAAPTVAPASKRTK